MTVNGIHLMRINPGIGHGHPDASFHTLRIGSGHGAAHALAAAVHRAANDLGVDSRFPVQRRLQVFQNQHGAAGTGNKAACRCG